MHANAEKHASSGHALLAQSKQKAKLLGAKYHNRKKQKEDLTVKSRATSTTSVNPFDMSPRASNNTDSTSVEDNTDDKNTIDDLGADSGNDDNTVVDSGKADDNSEALTDD